MHKNILVIGGTRFFGIPMVQSLLEKGHNVTIATRGETPDKFGNYVNRIKLNVYDDQSAKQALSGRGYDVVIDKMGYGSLDVKSILDNVECNHFIHMSTAGVYQLDHENIVEDEFEPKKIEIEWCTRGQADYDDVKRMAEAAIVQCYPDQDFSIIRSPFVLGELDYTGRFGFYVNCVVNNIPMSIDNLDAKFSVANATELGSFMADLADIDGVGCINYCSEGQLSIRALIDRIVAITGNKAIISKEGEYAPYNGTKTNSLSLEKVKKYGFIPSNVDEWVSELIEYYVNKNGKA